LELDLRLEELLDVRCLVLGAVLAFVDRLEGAVRAFDGVRLGAERALGLGLELREGVLIRALLFLLGLCLVEEEVRAFAGARLGVERALWLGLELREGVLIRVLLFLLGLCLVEDEVRDFAG